MPYTESGKQIGDKTNMSYAGHSNVGFPNIYEDSNQKNIKKSEVDEVTRHSGENVKGFMPKDQPGEVNRLYEERLKRARAEALKKDPTLAATMHNNKPSKGAIIDREIEEEERAMLEKKKGKGMTGESHY
ncbi:hypothetical protein QBC40DRAFT_283184 [Triangularia verruculosa]|uniref:Uncharacterized protein n=1 Tax=Triangularia verruculosa TaxID=2587418 RepID=A0AAN6XEE7_9PEZI|nr:hypothetical protein QBC40DRAFT_283184 [Triangularia verruculosa]